MQLTRDQVISRLRAKLLTLVDDEHSICEVATDLNIFCGGFAQWTFTELRQRYSMISKSRPHITPAELEDLANRWQLARQKALGTELACDSQFFEDGFKRTCRGWDEWDDDQLAYFHLELCGEGVEIIPQPREASAS